MLTRGRAANHVYLQVFGDGDPHTLIRPDTMSPRTPTETLQQILARDEAPLSAGTVLRELNDPGTIWRPCSTGVSQRSRLPIQVRCPGFQAFHQRSTTIRSGEATWQSDPNLSPTSPTRSKITPAEVLASQPGHRREVTRACRSSAKLQCGVPPTASIPKTRVQPEEAANSVQQPPSGNSDSTGTPPVPRIRQAPRDMTNDTRHTPH